MHTIDFTRQRKIHEFITDLHLQATQDSRIHTCVHDQGLVCLQKCFFKYNEGLERRFPWRYSIKSYSDTELKQIFEKSYLARTN